MQQNPERGDFHHHAHAIFPHALNLNTAFTMLYRRHFIEGGSYFFTVNLAERKRRLLVEHIDALGVAIGLVRGRHPFHIDVMVVMPDHIHAIFTMPPGDADYPTRWMLIKAGFSRQIPKTERINASRRSKGERGIYPKGTSGSADFGSTRCKTKTISITTSITSITTPSSTVTLPVPPNGRIPASVNTYVPAYYPPIGAPPPPKTTNGLGSVGWGEARTPTRQP
nr:hypothetical protein [Methylomonas albis]